jgi:Staphylococcal nuclease homologue
VRRYIPTLENEDNRLCFPHRVLTDTLEVLRDQHPKRIRLSGISCPEKSLAYGQLVKQAASVLVYSKTVTLQTHSLDKYKRAIADVLLPDGTNVIHALVKDGRYCWCLKYATILKLQGSIPLLTLLPCPKINEVDQPLPASVER